MTEVTGLLEQLKQAKQEVELLKEELAKLNKTKETWYQKKASISREIVTRIKSLTGSKSSRNTLTGHVKELKVNRDKLNNQIKQEVEAIKKLETEYEKLLGTRDSKGSGQLLKQVQALEYKLETEPTSFEKEQKLVKKIKELKKKSEGLEEVDRLNKEIHTKSQEIQRLKKEANESHKQMRMAAGESQEYHEKLVGNSKEIDEMRQKEKEAHDEFMKHEAEYLTKNEQLKEKLNEYRKIREQLEGHKVQLDSEYKEQERKTLKEKEAEVKEKIKLRKKLTTEDILVMQKVDDGKE